MNTTHLKIILFVSCTPASIFPMWRRATAFRPTPTAFTTSTPSTASLINKRALSSNQNFTSQATSLKNPSLLAFTGLGTALALSQMNEKVHATDNSSQEANPQEEPSQEYTKHKEELLRQAKAISSESDLFFECFAHSFPQGLDSLAQRSKSCHKLMDTMEQKKLIKSCTSSKRKDPRYNPNVRKRIYLECDFLTNEIREIVKAKKKYGYIDDLIDKEFKSPKWARLAWQKALKEIKVKRNETLSQWPEEHRKKYPHLAIAAFLNEAQCPVNSSFRPEINPDDFIQLRENTLTQPAKLSYSKN